MSDADKASRLTITTYTVGDEYYDQVLALSAQVVNDGWEKLTETYTDLQRIDFEDEDVGKLNGELLPCRISFDGTNRAGIKVFYQIRFKSGTLQSPSGSLTQDIAGWVLTVSVAVAEQQENEMTPEQAQYIKDNFNVPGDYSLARLYADLTDAHWNDMVTDRSTFGVNDDGTPITWEQWSKANPSLKIKLISFLASWVDYMRTRAYTTLGVKVVIPTPEEQNPLDPTFPPTAMLHQGFRYQNDQTPVGVAKDFDCIMYCEQLMERPLPTRTFIADGGNWCYPEFGSSPAVYGTFNISGQIFFQRKNGLLEHIRPFCRLSEITLKDVSISPAGMNHYFNVGYNPDHTSAEDNYFLPTIDETEFRYVWNMTHLNQNGKTLDSGRYYFCSHNSDQTVALAWKPGSNTIDLSGKTTYQYASQFWHNSDKVNLDANLEESYTATWDVPILIETDDEGRLTLVLGKHPSEVLVDVVLDYSKEYNIETRQDSIPGYMGGIQGTLQNALLTVQNNLAQIFATTGQWVYPGNGTLYFRDPMFNNYSDVLATVEYKPIPAGRRVQVPPPSAPPTLVPYTDSTPNEKSFTTVPKF
ncbi:hypothetical protein F4779DRAFT_576048 [Xylariaceae sp. FL0662B]|nr:hypothetical protein F4779DRAFT_576048 [Xylariaceae sp. FL0662B]